MKSLRVFDIFFDLPHPGASRDSERARMIEPPETTHSAVMAEMYAATAISRLARFAFPEHDDHKHALELQAKANNISFSRRRGSGFINRFDDLNKLDIYLLGFKSERITFSVTLQDGETRLYGHTLRYLPSHRNAKARADVGRRGVRAMVLLTRAPGGDRFYTSVLKTIEAVMMQGNALASVGDMEDVARERAMRVLHSLYLRHVKKQSDAMLQIRKKELIGLDELDDVSVSVAALEHEVDDDGYVKGTLPGDFVKFQTPPSLQAGFLPNQNPDDSDVQMLPLLRCLGPENTLRLLTALMCEVRVILVSADVVRVSNCVRAAAALLAQGNLSWRNNHVPVLPPHLLSCLAEPTPYLVGLLDEFLTHVEILQSLKDVLCVHLDKNQIKTFGMSNPGQRIPDLLKGSQGKDGIAGVLYNDMQQILRAESRIWGAGTEEKKTDDAAEVAQVTTARRKKGKAKVGDDIVTDIAGLFTRVMRGEDLVNDDQSIIDDSLHNPDANELARLGLAAGHVPRTKAGQHIMDLSTVDTFDVCDNERGEEGLRAALTSFFLVTHGDLGSMLSKGPQGFLLDRQKYLLTKKKTGIRERSPLFNMYKSFSGSSMLAYHLSQRIEDIERGRSLLMPRHRTLFSLCERHLRIKKIDFTSPNIRKVVSRTTIHSPIHLHMERSEVARAKALALTSTNPYAGNVSEALSVLMQECHDTDDSLPQVMAVIWARLDDKKANSWKHPLLGLHLLKNLLLHGPLTTLAFAMDGADKVRKLRFYQSSREDHNEEIHESAKTVWALVMDRPLLLLKRRQVVASRAKLIDAQQGQRWGAYLIKRVPFETSFKKYHILLRPRPTLAPCFMKEKVKQEGVQRVVEMEIARMKLAPRLDGELKMKLQTSARRNRSVSPPKPPIDSPNSLSSGSSSRHRPTKPISSPERLRPNKVMQVQQSISRNPVQRKSRIAASDASTLSSHSTVSSGQKQATATGGLSVSARERRNVQNPPNEHSEHWRSSNRQGSEDVRLPEHTRRSRATSSRSFPTDRRSHASPSDHSRPSSHGRGPNGIRPALNGVRTNGLRHTPNGIRQTPQRSMSSPRNGTKRNPDGVQKTRRPPPTGARSVQSGKKTLKGPHPGVRRPLPTPNGAHSR